MEVFVDGAKSVQTYLETNQNDVSRFILAQGSNLMIQKHEFEHIG